MLLQAADIFLIRVAHTSMPKGERVLCLSGGHSGKDMGGLRLFQKQEAVLEYCRGCNSPLAFNNSTSVISDKAELFHNAIVGYKVIGACGGV